MTITRARPTLKVLPSNNPRDALAPFGAELPRSTGFALSITSNSQHRDTAQTLFDFLIPPEATRVFRAAGLDPA